MKKRYIYFLIPFILVIVTVFGGYYYINSKIYKPLNKTSDDISNDKKNLNLKEEQGIINILLVGVDARGNYEDSRTDSIILLTINTNTKKIKLTSFMRDMYVPIPEHQDSRINTSFFLGGVELLLKTINQDFNLNIQNYVSVDFHAFQDIVDKLGGIDVEVKDYEVKEINKYIKEVNGSKATLLSGPGMQHLNGQQALSYCRIRKVGNGDYERTERQRKVLSLLIEKARKTSLFKLPDLVSTVLPYVRTNIPTTKLMSIGYTAYKFGDTPVETLRIPANGLFENANIRGMAVLLPDIEKNTELLNRFIFLDGSASVGNIPAYMNNNYHEKDKAIDNRGKKKTTVKVVVPKDKIESDSKINIDKEEDTGKSTTIIEENNTESGTDKVENSDKPSEQQGNQIENIEVNNPDDNNTNQPSN